MQVKWHESVAWFCGVRALPGAGTFRGRVTVTSTPGAGAS